jgi:hypothetical protein
VAALQPCCSPRRKPAQLTLRGLVVARAQSYAMQVNSHPVQRCQCGDDSYQRRRRSRSRVQRSDASSRCFAQDRCVAAHDVPFHVHHNRSHPYAYNIRVRAECNCPCDHEVAHSASRRCDCHASSTVRVPRRSQGPRTVLHNTKVASDPAGSCSEMAMIVVAMTVARICMIALQHSGITASGSRPASS